MGDAAFKTVTTGATVYVLGQAAKAIFVDPIMEQRKVIGEIAYNLMYLAPWYANPGGARPASTVRKHPGSRALLPRSQSRTVGHGLNAPEPPQVEAEALCAPTGRRLPRCGAPRRDHRAGPVRTPTVTPCDATAFDPQESGARRTRASKFWRAPGSIGLTR